MPEWLRQFHERERAEERRNEEEEQVTLLNEAMREGGTLRRDPIVGALALSIEEHASVLATTLEMEKSPGQKVYTVTACIEMLESELRHLSDRYDIIHTQNHRSATAGGAERSA